jgi:hypothetical protein
MLIYPGGLGRFAAGFFMQFYAYAYAGAIVTAALSTCTGLLIFLIIKRITSFTPLLPVLSLIPAVISIFPQLDVNSHLEGTIGYILMLLSILVYLRITSCKYRFIFSVTGATILFGLTGSIALLFSILILLHQLLTDFRRSYRFTITVVWTIAIGYATVLSGYTASMRFAFLPDLYYHHLLPVSSILYWQWITTLLVFFFAYLLRPITKKTNRKTSILLIIPQAVILLIVWRVFLIQYGDYKSAAYKKIDYLARNEQWDAIIDESKGKITNTLLLCHLNMALANKNQLAEKMFHFDQKGIDGLLINWDHTLQTACLLSDLYFVTGNIAASQQIAFEGYVISKDGNPRLLKRLVQTNLIMGAYPVAEKYIKLLEQTCYSNDWAKKHRRFLYDDHSVEADSLLGIKRKSVISKNCLYNTAHIVDELTGLAENNPEYTVPVQYLGSMYLLARDLVPFKELLDHYCMTEVLTCLPQSFQEAILLICGNNADMLSKYDLDDEIRKKYIEFQKFILLNQQNPELPSLACAKYGHTYWFYYIFKQ